MPEGTPAYAYGLIIWFMWFVWWMYWRIKPKDFKPVAQRESIASRASHIVPLFLAVVLIAYPWRISPTLSLHVLPYGPATFWIGAAMNAAGLLYTVWARLHLAGNWSAIVTLKEDHELIRTGPYGWTRHPIYTGIIVAILGGAVALDEVRGFIGFALAVGAFIRKLGIEERLMIETFGAGYDDYRKDVKALIPGVF